MNLEDSMLLLILKGTVLAYILMQNLSGIS